jgi:CBS domain-containing protein
MKVADILRTKGSSVVTISPDRPVQDALRILVDNDIGALLVYDGGLQGIFTERDVLKHAATDVRRLESARVKDLMTVNLIIASSETDINAVMQIMAEQRIRHLPVLDNGAISGIISIRDVVNALRQTAESENQQLHAYITGTVL